MFQRLKSFFPVLAPVVGLALVLVVTTAPSQEAPPSEHQVKAAFLFNFAKFVEWPAATFPETNSPIIFGVMGESPFGKVFEDTVRDKKINNRPVIVKPVPTPQEGKTCHILFINPSEKNRLPEIVEAVRSSSVLTVSETEQFIQSGGIINFMRENNKIRFEISDDAARRAGLKISSKLLSLAVRPTR